MYIRIYCNEKQTSERSDEASPYLIVAREQAPVRKFPERLRTSWLYLENYSYFPCVYVCVRVCTCVYVCVRVCIDVCVH